MRRKSPARTFRNWSLYRALKGFSAAGQSLSLPGARSVGAGIGRLAHRTVSRERRRALDHLAIAFPDMPLARREELAREMFIHLGKCLMEITWLPNLNRDNLAVTTRLVNYEKVQAALATGNGVVAFTGHCGNWEWLASTWGVMGIDLSVVAREIDDERLNDFIVERRQLHGVKTIGRGSGSSARDILSTLRRGAALGVLIDQDIKAESVEVPFFGRLASTPVGPAKLAIRSGAWATPTFTWREGDVQVVDFGDPIPTTRGDDPEALTALMTAKIEEQIRRVPEQWVWMHRRWGKHVTK